MWKDGSDQTWHFPVDSAQELSAIVDILRNESPVSYDPEQEMIGVACEPVGEGEGT